MFEKGEVGCLLFSRGCSSWGVESDLFEFLRFTESRKRWRFTTILEYRTGKQVPLTHQITLPSSQTRKPHPLPLIPLPTLLRWRIALPRLFPHHPNPPHPNPLRIHLPRPRTLLALPRICPPHIHPNQLPLLTKTIQHKIRPVLGRYLL